MGGGVNNRDDHSALIGSAHTTSDTKEHGASRTPLPSLNTVNINGSRRRIPDVDVLLNFFDGFEFIPLAQSGEKRRDIIAIVSKLHDLIGQHFPHTPMYNYTLLDSQFAPGSYMLKLENIQRFGTVSVRAFASIIYCNFLQQTYNLGPEKCAKLTPKTLIIPVFPENFSTNRYIQEIVFVARHMNLDVEIVTTVAGLSTWVLFQLYNCKAVGANITWVNVDVRADAEAYVLGRAISMYNVEHGSILLDPVYDREFALLGVATCAHEMVMAAPQVSTIIVPIQQFVMGWSTVAGMALYAGCVSKQRVLSNSGRPIRVIASYLVEDQLSSASAASMMVTDVPRGTQLTDVTARAWLSNRNDKCSVENVFTAWDADGDGNLTDAEINAVLRGLGTLYDVYY